MSTRTATNIPMAAVALTSFFWIDWTNHSPMPCQREDFFDEDRADEDQREFVSEKRSHGNQRGAQRVFDQRLGTAQPLGLSSADEVAAKHVEHRVALIPAVERESLKDQNQRRQDQVLDPVGDSRLRKAGKPGRVFSGVIDDAPADQVVDRRSRDCHKYREHNSRDGQKHEGNEGHQVIGETVLFDRAVRTRGHPGERTEDGSDQQKTQADSHPPLHLGVDGAAVDGQAEIAVHQAIRPPAESPQNRRFVVQVELIELRIDHGGRRGRIAAFEVGTGIKGSPREYVG